MAPVRSAMATETVRPSRIDLRYWSVVALVAAAYVGAAKLGFSFAFATRQVTAVWPPTGIAIAALLLFGLRSWPGVFLGAFVSNAISNEPLFTAAGIAVGNTIGPVLGAFLLRRVGHFNNSLRRVPDVLALVCLGSAIAMTVTATNGVINLILGGIIPWSACASVWWVWWAGDAMGVLLFAPLLLTWATEHRVRWRGARLAELAALFIALIVVSEVSFTNQLPLAYPVFPFVIWAALRFGQRGSACAVIAVSAIAIWNTIHDRGPFMSGTLDHRLILLVTFMAVVAVTGLLLGAVTAERQAAENSLRRAHDELERRVVERTAELATANTQLTTTNEQLNRSTVELANKNEEVQAFVYIVSHDLRSPLVNLQGFVKELELSCTDLEKELLRANLPPDVVASTQSTFDQGIRGALRYIAASADKFERLIGALLTLSRTGQQNYRTDQVDVAAVADTTLDSLRQTIAERSTEVTVGPLPKAVGDATAIGQVLSNLLVNALKYQQPGRRGQIHVGGEVRNGFAHYWVRDNGAGIPATAQKRLFQVFQRFHPELAAGDGIGLAAVKRMIERQGGQIRAESESGVGSTFHFTLPAAA